MIPSLVERGPDGHAVVAPAGRGGTHLRRGGDRRPRAGDPSGPDRRADPWRGHRVVQVDCAEPARAAQLIDEAGIAAGTTLTDAGLTVTLPAGSLARARRRHQPAAGRGRDRGLRPPGDPDVAGGLVLVRDEPTGRAIMTTTQPSLSSGEPKRPPAGARPGSAPGCPAGPSSPRRTWRLRKRRGLIIIVALLIVGPTVLILACA